MNLAGHESMLANFKVLSQAFPWESQKKEKNDLR